MLLLQASLQVSSGGTNKLMQGMACGTDFNCVITSDWLTCLVDLVLRKHLCMLDIVRLW